MRNRYINLGWLITLIIAILPIAIWLITQQSDWSTTKLLVENLGKLAGLSGLALFCWSVILSARLKIFGRWFMGLDNMYRAHHLISCFALILLLIHPMLLTTRYLLSSPISAYEFIKPSPASPFRILGSLTLFSFIALMILALYVNMRQERMVLVMRLLGLLVFFGGLHAILVGGSDINSLIWLQIYILGLLATAGVVYIYRSLFHGNFAKFYDYNVTSIEHKNDIIELHLEPKEKPITFLPGQFAFVKIDSDGVLGQSHPFSISSTPSQTQVRFSIKQLGDYTSALSQAKVGQSVKIDAPYGSFSNKVVKSNRQVWVAGGIGVTPFLSMAASVDGSQQIDMYYSVKESKEAVYLKELQAIEAKNNNFRINLVDTTKSGYLTADKILTNIEDIDTTAFMICGPPSMMKSIRQQLKVKGVKNRSIHTEEFSLL